MARLRLGRKPERRLVKLKLTDVADVDHLYKQVPDPNNVGHVSSVPQGLMYRNDVLGCCVVAGAEHEHDTMARMTGRPAPLFDDAATVRNYTLLGGYDPSQTDAQGNNPTDDGCDMEAAASLRLKHGIAGADGHLHKIDAYFKLDQGDLKQLVVALHFFFVAGGMHFYDYMQDEFDQRKLWNWNARGKDEGGHYTFLPGIHQGRITAITWGRAQAMTKACWSHAYDLNLAYYSKEMLLPSGKSLEGFDEAYLLRTVKEMTR